jgi:hypothetical protein
MSQWILAKETHQQQSHPFVIFKALIGRAVDITASLFHEYRAPQATVASLKDSCPFEVRHGRHSLLAALQERAAVTREHAAPHSSGKVRTLRRLSPPRQLGWQGAGQVANEASQKWLARSMEICLYISISAYIYLERYLAALD